MAARSVLVGLSRLVSTRFTYLPAAKTQILASQPKSFHTSHVFRCKAAEAEEAAAEERGPARNPLKARDQVIPVETSIAYLTSEAYKTTYGDNPVWKEYRRNYKGHWQPRKTRKTCIRGEELSTGNPCPACRDEYLVLDYRNISLLEQFICPHTGAVLSYTTTGLCQKKHQQLLIAVDKARDCGYLTYDVPHRVYDYSEYIQIKQ